jgi:hypothetical protein
MLRKHPSPLEAAVHCTKWEPEFHWLKFATLKTDLAAPFLLA